MVHFVSTGSDDECSDGLADTDDEDVDELEVDVTIINLLELCHRNGVYLYRTF